MQHRRSCCQANGKYIIKSGTDFRNLGRITLTFGPDGSVDVDVAEVTIDSSMPEDDEVKAIVSKYLGSRCISKFKAPLFFFKPMQSHCDRVLIFV